MRKFLVFLILSLISALSFALSADPYTSKLKRFTRLQMEEDETPGVVVLLSSPKIGVRHFSLGHATLTPKFQSMTINNNFRVASISKTFLAVMILKLVEQQKIDLAKPIATYLPKDLDLALIPNVEKITVHHLLNMTSGIPEYYDLDVDDYLSKHPYRTWKPKDALAFSTDLKPKFRPGKGYEYSNTNYVLLQMILQQVTQKSISENLESMICQPLQLKHTFADDFKLSPFTLTTKGYDTKKNEMDVSELDDGFGIGDTFVVTDALDLNRFLTALFLDKTVLKPATLAAMLTPNAYGRYGYGVEISNSKHWGKVYSHNGLVNGFQTNYFYVPKFQLTVIILTNNRATKLIEPVFVRSLYLYPKL